MDERRNRSRIVAVTIGGYLIFSIADSKGKKAIVNLAAVTHIAGKYGYAGAQAIALFIGTFFLIGFSCGSAERIERKECGLRLSDIAHYRRAKTLSGVTRDLGPVCITDTAAAALPYSAAWRKLSPCASLAAREPTKQSPAP